MRCTIPHRAPAKNATQRPKRDQNQQDEFTIHSPSGAVGFITPSKPSSTSMVEELREYPGYFVPCTSGSVPVSLKGSVSIIDSHTTASSLGKPPFASWPKLRCHPMGHPSRPMRFHDPIVKERRGTGVCEGGSAVWFWSVGLAPCM